MHETPPSTERTGAVLGSRIGEYRIDRAVGDGTSGQVVGARGDADERVAIKIAHTTHPETTARFKRSARAMMALESPHIVRVHEVLDTKEGLACMVMEWLDGQHLAAELDERGLLPVEDVVRWMLQVCAALNEAHDNRVFHRDLKPENMFLADVRGERVVKVLDFGFAPPFPHLGPAEKRTRPGALAGTSPYLAPEQLQKSEVDARTDIWAVGATMFRLLTNRHPFSGTNIGDVAANILSEIPADVGALRPDVNEELEAVVARCLEKSPRQRFDTVRDLEVALRAAIGGSRNTPVVELDGATMEDLRATPQVTRVAPPVDEVTEIAARPTPLTIRAASPLDAPTMVADAPTATDLRPPHMTGANRKSVAPKPPKSTSLLARDPLPPIAFQRPSAKPSARPPRRAEVPSRPPPDDPPTGLTELENIVEIEDVQPVSPADGTRTPKRAPEEFPSAPFTPLALPSEPARPTPAPMAPAPPPMLAPPTPAPFAVAAPPTPFAPPTPQAFPPPHFQAPPAPFSPPPAAFPSEPMPLPYGSQPVPVAPLSSVRGAESEEIAVLRRGAITTVKKRSAQASTRGTLIAFTVAFVLALGLGALYVFRYSALAESLGTKPEPPRSAPTATATAKAPVPAAPAITATAEPTPSAEPEPAPEPSAPTTTPVVTATVPHRRPLPRPPGDDILNKRK